MWTPCSSTPFSPPGYSGARASPGPGFLPLSRFSPLRPDRSGTVLPLDPAELAEHGQLPGPYRHDQSRAFPHFVREALVLLGEYVEFLRELAHVLLQQPARFLGQAPMHRDAQLASPQKRGLKKLPLHAFLEKALDRSAFAPVEILRQPHLDAVFGQQVDDPQAIEPGEQADELGLRKPVGLQYLGRGPVAHGQHPDQEQLGIAHQLALLFLAQFRDTRVGGARHLEPHRGKKHCLTPRPLNPRPPRSFCPRPSRRPRGARAARSPPLPHRFASRSKSRTTRRWGPLASPGTTLPKRRERARLPRA